ncbi:hypothetical protein EV294_107193 [Paenibacillus sp. BK033]|uniref:hypothetical protein n=1 Tax=Paenibacillus sp. BK033 TaxID=2512133 RepID=UPI0010ED50E1|nr:hypothetical protein [Paenibacillus sp. BK033]TCM93242.1 hypothetical protein EV294_107193 [Paenibacillus sp. BK033]
MRIIMVVVLLMCFITTGCKKDELIITSEQIKTSFESKDIQLFEPQELSPENVFIKTLNNVRPEFYAINENQLISFYIYSSHQEAEKGLKDFEESTAATDLVKHSEYQIANVLLFYQYATKDERVEEIMKRLEVKK